MPLLKLETTISVSEQQRQQLLTSLSKVVAEAIGKPEQYVMVTIGAAAILMSGKSGDAALVDIRSIGGLTRDVNRGLSRSICKLLSEILGISSDRVYLNFANVDALPSKRPFPAAPDSEFVSLPSARFLV